MRFTIDQAPLTKTRRIILTRLAFTLTAVLVAQMFYTNLQNHEIQYNGPCPVFLFVITDDQSWIHTSYARYPALQTPNFDGIADEGVYFENAFASALLHRFPG